MTRQESEELRTRVEETTAGAASGTAGVAFLRPGLADLVRGTAIPYLRLTSGGPESAARTAGVRVRQGTDPARWEVQVQLAVVRGHRAVDVARAVRTAVAEAVRAELEPRPPEVAVRVTVTDLV